MKKITKWFFGVLCVCSVMSTGFLTIAASADTVTIAEEIFPNEQVDEIEKEILMRTVYDDKDKEGKFFVADARSSTNYPTRSGIILVTSDKYKGLIPTGHAAIVWAKPTVIESLANGVVTGPNDWYNSKTTCYGVAVNGTTFEQDDYASNWCYGQRGKPYNFNFYDVGTREKFYCSQLVWAAFKDNYNIDLNTSEFGVAVHPLELAVAQNTYIVYKK